MDDGPAGPGIWIVSFTDCMTNLMTFFVMLVSFASFDKHSMSKLGGVFDSMSKQSIFSSSKPRSDSMLPPVGAPSVTENGSESPNERPAEMVKASPASPATLDVQHARHQLSLATNKMFWGKGAALQPEGQRNLAAIAGYLAKIPRVVVVEVGGAAEIERAAAVVAFLTDRQGLRGERFCISVGGPSPAVIKLIVLAKEVCP